MLEPIDDGDEDDADGRSVDLSADLPPGSLVDDGVVHIGQGGATTADVGRYVRPRLGRVEPGADVAVDASLRAAALRGRTDVRSRDLRLKLRDGETPLLVVFAVDVSASMRAHGHIATAERLTTSVLRAADRGRDYVAVVAFRDQTAEVVVPPTADPARAAARLDALPTGNETPLSAGLLAALRLIEREREAAPDLQAAVVAMTDGRPTAALRGDPVGEATRVARRLGAADVDLIVLDLDRGTSGRAVCRDLAAAADGEHVRMDDLSAAERRRVVTRRLRRFRSRS